LIRINKVSAAPETIFAPEAMDDPNPENFIRPFKTKHKLYKDALLYSGAELTVTNDMSLFIEDSLEYLDDNFDFNIV